MAKVQLRGVLEVPGDDGGFSMLFERWRVEVIMRTRCYPSDLTDVQWTLVAPLARRNADGAEAAVTASAALFCALVATPPYRA
jgi:hypothetical protein